MRKRATVAVAAVLAVTLAGCSDRGADYTVVRKAQAGSTGSADLILPNASRQEARDALRDYAGGIDGVDLYYLKVMRSEGAQGYVCRARWYRDARAFAAHTVDGAVPSHWPHLAVRCP